MSLLYIDHAQKNTFQLIKITTIFTTMLLFSACSSLGGGSLEKRADKLSRGIQSTYKVPVSTANYVSPLIIENSERNNLDPLLVAAVIHQESSYRPKVVSGAGAVGLMQIMPRYWQATCGSDLHNEEINIQCGTSILAKYQQLGGNLKTALGYYNVGPSAYKNNRKMRKQGKKYAKQVLTHKKQLKSSL